MDEIVDVNTLFGPLPQASNDLTVESLLALMQHNGVGARLHAEYARPVAWIRLSAMR